MNKIISESISVLEKQVNSLREMQAELRLVEFDKIKDKLKTLSWLKDCNVVIEFQDHPTILVKNAEFLSELQHLGGYSGSIEHNLYLIVNTHEVKIFSTSIKDIVAVLKEHPPKSVSVDEGLIEFMTMMDDIETKRQIQNERT